MELDRYYKTREILNKFKNGEKLYKKSPQFNKCVHMLVDGTDIYSVLEDIIIANEALQHAFEDHLLNYR